LRGVDNDLASLAPPLPARIEQITGRVTLADNTPVPRVLAILRSVVHGQGNPPACDRLDESLYVFSDPMTFDVTNEKGEFHLDRPAGVYEIEFFSDEYDFAPGEQVIESPNPDVRVIAVSKR
jgi:hypothetical protein